MAKKQPLYPHVPKSRKAPVHTEPLHDEIIMYHVTPLKNLNSILSTGLKPESHKVFAELQKSRGVYLAKGLIFALNVLRHTLEAEPKLAGDYALLEVRVSESSLAPDPDYQSYPPVAFITKDVITPKNIRHIATFNGQSKDYTAVIRQTWGERRKDMPFFIRND